MTTAQALESVLNAWVNGRKVRDGIPLTIRQQAEQALLTADAQATVEALQAIIKQMGEQAAVLAKDGMAAKAQAEALQQEVELQETAVRCASHVLDKSRETHNRQAAKIREQQEQLSQFQALVRAAVERWRAQTNVKEGISFRMAMKALEATLDATTPAMKGGDGE